MLPLTVRLQLHRRQKQFLDSRAQLRGFVGGRGAGKSFVGAYDLLRRAKPNRLYMVTAPTYPMLKDSSFRTFLELARLLHVVSPSGINRSSMTVTLGNGAEVLFRSADDPERLRGPNLSGVWMDEASVTVREAFEITLACLREAGEQGWFSATFTPKGRLHWTFEAFTRDDPSVSLTRAKTLDNPFLPAGFEQTLRGQYSSLMAEQELGGEFVEGGGTLFSRQWFAIADATPAGLNLHRHWDLAATEAKPGRDPDWTVGALVGRSKENVYYVLDIRRARATPKGVEQLVRQTAELDGKTVPITIEQEPGASGVTVLDHYLRNVLSGWNLRPERPSGDKATRAQPLSAQAEGGNVKLLRGPWNKTFLDEAEVFPAGAHDDQVDAVASAFNTLAGKAVGPPTIGIPRKPGLVDSAPEGVFGR